MKSIFEQALVALLQNNQEKANELFHDFVIGRAKEIKESLAISEDDFAGDIDDGSSNLSPELDEARTPKVGVCYLKDGNTDHFWYYVFDSIATGERFHKLFYQNAFGSKQAKLFTDRETLQKLARKVKVITNDVIDQAEQQQEEDFDYAIYDMGYAFEDVEDELDESVSVMEGKSYKRNDDDDDEDADDKKKKDQERKKARDEKKHPVSESVESLESKVSKLQKEYAKCDDFPTARREIKDRLDKAKEELKAAKEKVEEGKSFKRNDDDEDDKDVKQKRKEDKEQRDAKKKPVEEGKTFKRNDDDEDDKDVKQKRKEDKKKHDEKEAKKKRSDESIEDLAESLAAELEKINVTMTDGGEVGDGAKAKVNMRSPVPSHGVNDRVKQAKAAVIKGTEVNGFDKEAAPKVAGSTKGTDNVLSKSTASQKPVKPAMTGNDDKSAKSPLSGLKKSN